MTRPERPRVFFENLDGLRTLCFLSVFLHHSFATVNPEIAESSGFRLLKLHLVDNGSLGVNFFFVLSGFLITYLLFEEIAHFGSLSLGRFYARRCLRICPLFYLCLVFGFLGCPILKAAFGQTPAETADWRMYATFLNNFDMIEKGLPDCLSLAVLWSVAVEEQFYLFWPILIVVLPRRAWTAVLTTLVAFSFAFRLASVGSGNIHFHTFSCISDLAIGGLLAHGIREWCGLRQRVENAPRAIWVGFYLFLLSACLFRQHLFFTGGALLQAGDRLFFGLCFGLVILEQSYAKNSLFKMSRFRILTRAGKYTYGLYCLHMIGILVATELAQKYQWNQSLGQIILVEGGLSLGMTALLAWVSYEYYESRFLKLKEKYANILTRGST